MFILSLGASGSPWGSCRLAPALLLAFRLAIELWSKRWEPVGEVFYHGESKLKYRKYRSRRCHKQFFARVGDVCQFTQEKCTCCVQR